VPSSGAPRAYASRSDSALHDKRIGDKPFVESLALIERAASDERNFMSTRRDRDNLARFGITAPKAFGVSMANNQVLAKRLGRSHELGRLNLLFIGVYGREGGHGRESSRNGNRVASDQCAPRCRPA
jgi:hypothetical protein